MILFTKNYFCFEIKALIDRSKPLSSNSGSIKNNRQMSCQTSDCRNLKKYIFSKNFWLLTCLPNVAKKLSHWLIQEKKNLILETFDELKKIQMIAEKQLFQRAQVRNIFQCSHSNHAFVGNTLISLTKLSSVILKQLQKKHFKNVQQLFSRLETKVSKYTWKQAILP